MATPRSGRERDFGGLLLLVLVALCGLIWVEGLRLAGVL
jgi:hypothetical protein